MSKGRAVLTAGVVCLMVVGSAPVRAQSNDEPDPCASVYGQMALANCWTREAERADEEMTRAYLALRQRLPDRAAESLEKAQKLWLEFRKAHLGTLYGVDDPRETFGRDYRVCMAISKLTLTRARTKELARLLEPDDEAICPL